MCPGMSTADVTATSALLAACRVGPFSLKSLDCGVVPLVIRSLVKGGRAS